MSRITLCSKFLILWRYHQFTGMAETLPQPPTLTSHLRSLLQRATHQPLASAGCLVLFIFLLCALFAPWLAPHDPTQLHLTARLLPPPPPTGSAPTS